MVVNHSYQLVQVLLVLGLLLVSFPVCIVLGFVRCLLLLGLANNATDLGIEVGRGAEKALSTSLV